MGYPPPVAMEWQLNVRGPDGPLARARAVAGARLGRAPEVEIVLAHPSVSRLHGRLVERDGRIWLVDGGSRNGLVLGGRRVAEICLEEGLTFGIGELTAEVVRAPSSAAPTTSAPPLQFAEDVTALLARTALRKQAAPVLDDLALEEPAAIDLERRAPPPRAVPESPAADSVLERRAALAKRPKGGGLWSGDLAQQPAWVRWLAVLCVPAVLGLALWGAFRLVSLAAGGP